MLLGSYEKAGGFKLPKEFKRFFGKWLLLAISGKKSERCIFLILSKAIDAKEISDLLFFGGVKISETGELKIPPLFFERISEYFPKQKKEKMIFIGCINWIEIWRKQDWEEYITTHNYEDILEKIVYEG